MCGHLVSLDLVDSTLIDSRTLVTDEIKIGARFIIAPGTPCTISVNPSELLGELLSP